MRARLREERGFTVVEVLVAALVMALGAVAVMQVLDASARNAYRAEQTQVAINVAQRELEKIRQYDYGEVALTSMPTTGSVGPELAPRISGTSFALNANGSNFAQMIVKNVDGQTGGSVPPGPTPFTLGDVSGKIYRFVVWQNDPGCSVLVCPGPKDYKRVSVVVKLDNVPISSDRPYQEVQSDITDPEASLTSGGGSGNGALVTAQQFFLSDTRCASSGEPTRQEITADHPTHDTLSTCQASSGKPDALLLEQPPDPFPDDPALPEMFDYADDVEPGGAPSQSDKGLQMLRQDANGCNPSPTGGDAKKKIHRWVTRPLPLTFVMTGSATLELYTRTINDVNIPGAICIYLFKRATVLGNDVRTAIPLTGISVVPPDPFGFSCSTVGLPAVGKCQTSIWPRDSWARVRFTMGFAPNTQLLLNERLELGLSVERGGTPEDALQFMYDHPDTPARIEVKTTTPLG